MLLMIENFFEDMETGVDAFVCPKAHFLQMQVSPKRRRGIPAGFEENEVIYASTVNTMLDLGCPQSLVMVN